MIYEFILPLKAAAMFNEQSPLPTRYAEGEDDGPTGKEYPRQCEEHRKELYGCDAVIEGRKELQRSINKINIASGEDVCV